MAYPNIGQLSAASGPAMPGPKMPVKKPLMAARRPKRPGLLGGGLPTQSAKQALLAGLKYEP